MDYNTSVYDEVGNSAVDGIGNLIDEIMLSPNEKAVKKMEPAKKYWESIRIRCSTGRMYRGTAEKV